MKRSAFLLVGLAFLGAGCWSSEPVAVQPAPVAPAPQVASPEPTPPAPTPQAAPEGSSSTMPGTVPTPEPTPTPKPTPVPQPPEPTYVTIEMSQDGFKPSQVTIKKDTIVRFKNVGGSDMWPASNPHPTHTAYQDFDARRSVKPGETYEFRFKVAGTWGCHDHLSPGLTCRIVVEE